jgi:hypothetical protein
MAPSVDAITRTYRRALQHDKHCDHSGFALTRHCHRRLPPANAAGIQHETASSGLRVGLRLAHFGRANVAVRVKEIGAQSCTRPTDLRPTHYRLAVSVHRCASESHGRALCLPLSGTAEWSTQAKLRASKPSGTRRAVLTYSVVTAVTGHQQCVSQRRVRVSCELIVESAGV